MTGTAPLPTAADLGTGLSRRRKPYPAYREATLPLLDQLPDHWSQKPLKRLVTNVLEKRNGGELPFVALEHVLAYEGVVVPGFCWDPKPSDGCVRFRPGDVLFGKLRPYLGKCIPADREGCCPTELLVFRPRSDVFASRFLYFLLLSSHLIALADSTSYGTKMPRTSWEKLGCEYLWAPPLPEQRAIAAFLDRETTTIDALIREKQRLIELLQEKRAAAITQAVTRGINPDVPMKDSGIGWLGEIPAHWEAKRAGFVFRERDERGFPDLPLLNVSLNTGVSVREFATDRIERTADDPSTYKRARAGDIAFNKMRMWQGAVGVAPVDGLVSPDYTVAFPLGDANSDYYVELFRTETCKTEIDKYSHGIVPDRNRLYWDGFKRLSLPFPPPDEQALIVERFQEATRQLDALASKITEGIEYLREYRSALISAAVTGKIDVRGETAT